MNMKSEIHAITWTYLRPAQLHTDPQREWAYKLTNSTSLQKARGSILPFKDGTNKDVPYLDA